MSETYKNLKTRSMKERLAKSSLATFSSYVLSLIQTAEKEKGSLSEAEVVTILQKLSSKCEEVLKFDATNESAKAEIAYLNEFLPRMATEAEVREFIATLSDTSNKGLVAKALKEKFGATVDMKKAMSWI